MLDPLDPAAGPRPSETAPGEPRPLSASSPRTAPGRRYAGPERRTPLVAAPGATPLALLIDEIDYGLVLLNEAAQVVHINHLARNEMDSGQHPLELQGRQVQARLATDHDALRDALAGAARRGRRCLLKLGAAGQFAMVSVVPLGHLGHSEPAIALIFGKRQVCEELSVQAFARVHRLTSAETKVLTALCNGSRVREVADRHGVETSTVRSQISSIRAKTGAESIAALVRQVAVLPPLVGVLRMN